MQIVLRFMKNIILCSSNPILVKSLYGMLRDEGHTVETIEHPAFAVQIIMKKHYDFIIIDSEPFGLSAEDAAEIIQRVAPAVQILFVGNDRRHTSAPTVETPVDLEEFKKKGDLFAV